MSDQTHQTVMAAQQAVAADSRDDSPEGVVRRLLDLLLAAETREQMNPIADLWAPDGTAEFPFAEGDSPTRLDGREAVRAYLAPYPEIYDVTDVRRLLFHHTTDPDTVVVEFTLGGRTVATGRPYEMRYVAILTIRDGAIVHYRDYWSPVQVARASGTVADLVATLRNEPTARDERTVEVTE